ncbi:MAG: hypothetical protein QW728_03105 [Thermoplasmata archaeon]
MENGDKREEPHNDNNGSNTNDKNDKNNNDENCNDKTNDEANNIAKTTPEPEKDPVSGICENQANTESGKKQVRGLNSRLNRAVLENTEFGTCTICKMSGPVVPARALSSEVQNLLGQEGLICPACFYSSGISSGLGDMLEKDIKTVILLKDYKIDTDEVEKIVARWKTELNKTISPYFFSKKPVWTFCAEHGPMSYLGRATSTIEFTSLAQRWELVGSREQSRSFFITLLENACTETGFPLNFFKGLWPEKEDKEWLTGAAPVFFIFQCSECGAVSMRHIFMNL